MTEVDPRGVYELVETMFTEGVKEELPRLIHPLLLMARTL
jgi:hypothetical protein